MPRLRVDGMLMDNETPRHLKRAIPRSKKPWLLEVRYMGARSEQMRNWHRWGRYYTEARANGAMRQKLTEYHSFWEAEWQVRKEGEGGR
jgi:hypothetical protein